MKCANCGAELKAGCVYCSDCGKEAQIVPDYNLLDDDEFYNNIISDKDTGNEVRNASKEGNLSLSKDMAEKEPAMTQKQGHKKLIICIWTSLVLLVVIIVISMIVINKGHYNSFGYQMNHGDDCFDNQEYDEAVSYYLRAAELDETNTAPLMSLAEIYELQNKNDDAIEMYRSVLEINHNLYDAYVAIIKLYEANKDYEHIIELMNYSEDPHIIKLFEEYTVGLVEFSEEAGDYQCYLNIQLKTSSGNYIFYTLDGSDPTTNGTQYTSSINIDKEGQYLLRAVCKNDKGIYGEICEAKYNINIPAPEMAEVTPNGGSFTSETMVYISVPAGCTAYYVWGTGDVSINSTKYSGGIAIPEGNNILSVIVVDDKTGKTSDIYRCHFEYYKQN